MYNTGLSITPREAVVTSVLQLLVQAADCQSITITLQDTSGAFCADLATLRLADFEMTLSHSSELQNTYVNLQRMTRSGRWSRNELLLPARLGRVQRERTQLMTSRDTDEYAISLRAALAKVEDEIKRREF